MPTGVTKADLEECTWLPDRVLVIIPRLGIRNEDAQFAPICTFLPETYGRYRIARSVALKCGEMKEHLLGRIFD